MTTTEAAASLTQAEAAERAALIAVERYDVTFDFTGLLTGDRMITTSTINFSCAAPGASSFVECRGTVTAASLNGSQLDVSTAAAGRLPLTGLAAENTLVVTLHQDDTGSSTGILKTVDPTDGLVYVWTTFEPDDASRVYACFDQPDLKSVHRFTALVPESWTAISNTPASSIISRDGVKTFEFADSPRLSPYVMVVNAGPFHELRRTIGAYDCGIYCRQSLASALEVSAEDIFKTTEHGLDWFAEKFGMPFPQERYDQIFVPNMGGAMENWGAVTHGDSVLPRSEATVADRAQRATVILHEMSHMWFGDLVTMRWWDDLWLNEAFASWASIWSQAAMPEYAEQWASFAVRHKLGAYRHDLSPATHPIRAVVPDVDQATANFDSITYYKGMSVLRQLHAYLGADAFEAGLRDYFREHAWSNTVLSDLMGAFGAAAGTDLTSWTDAWLDHAGTDVISLDDARTQITVTGPEGTAPRPHRFDIASFAADGRLIATTEVTTPSSWDAPATLAVELPDAAAHLLNAGDLTFASVRPDRASRDWLREHAGDLPDTMSRVLAGLSAWDGLVRGTIDGPQAIATMLSVLATERRPEIVESLLGLVATAAERWTPPSEVDGQRAVVAAAAYKLADDAVLAGPALRTLASHASAPEHFARVEAAVDGNADLAWRLLVRRSELGEYDADAVAALQERDTDPDAWVSALAADAARNDPDAKARAWQTIMVEARVPVGDTGFRAMAAFWRPGQEDVLQPYAERYLEAAESLNGSMLAAVPRLDGMFPFVGAGEEFLTASQAVATRPASSALVRQNLLRLNDLLERQLRARRLAQP